MCMYMCIWHDKQNKTQYKNVHKMNKKQWELEKWKGITELGSGFFVPWNRRQWELFFGCVEHYDGMAREWHHLHRKTLIFHFVKFARVDFFSFWKGFDAFFCLVSWCWFDHSSIFLIYLIGTCWLLLFGIFDGLKEK